MRIENASIFDVNDSMTLIHIMGSDTLKIRQKSNQPAMTPFDKPFAEIVVKFQELQEIVNTVNSLKLIRSVSK